MIIRIAGEGQFHVPSSALDSLNDIDDRIVDAVGKEDASGFNQLFGELLTAVRTQGKPLENDDLHDSEVILPFSDLTLNEARNLFVGDGLIPNPAAAKG